MKMKNIELKKEYCEKIKEQYERYVKISERYNADGELLKKHITNNSHTSSEAYFKATLNSSCYSTRMGADRIYAAAQKIKDKKETIGKIIDEGPEKHLNFLTKFLLKEKDTKQYLPYSFFTKYFAIHQMYVGKGKQVNCPIYDSFVEKVIKHSDIYEEDDFKKYREENDCNRNLRNYKNLYWTIQYFADKLTEGNFTDLDHILWLLGKTIFKKERGLNHFDNMDQVIGKIEEDIESEKK